MDTYLMHHGIKGMKWGIRRYQNPDGSLTAAGLARVKKDFSDNHSRLDLKSGNSYYISTDRKSGKIKDENGKKVERYQTLSVKEKHNQQADYTIDKKYNTVVAKSVLKGDTNRKIVDLKDEDIARGKKLYEELKAKQEQQMLKDIEKEERRKLLQDVYTDRSRSNLTIKELDEYSKAGVNIGSKDYERLARHKLKEAEKAYPGFNNWLVDKGHDLYYGPDAHDEFVKMYKKEHK